MLIKKCISAVTEITLDRRSGFFSPWSTLSVITVATIAAVLLRNGPVHIMAPWDIFIVLDGAWRILGGQIPHTDFYNPIGPITYLLTSTGMRITPSLSSVVYGNLIFLGLITIWIFLVSHRRLTGLHGFLFTIFIALLVVAVRPLGYDPEITTYAMIYNRYGWALFSLLLVQLFMAPRSTGSVVILPDALSIGLLVGVLLFCKVSFFVVGVLAVCLALMLRSDLRKSAAMVVIGFIAVCLGMWFTFGISTFDYIQDLASAGHAQSLGQRFAFFLTSFQANVLSIFLIGLILLGLKAISFRVAKTRGERAAELKLALVVSFVVISSLVLATANAPEGRDLPLFFIAGIILLEHIAKDIGIERQGSLMKAEKAYLIVLTVTISVFAGGIFVKDIQSLVNSIAWRGYRESSVPESQRFDAEALRDFVIPHTSKWRTAYWTAKYIPARINEGLRLLRGHVSPSSKIFTVALTNPFSLALGLPSPKGTPLWWDLDYSFSKDRYPNAEKIFADTNMLMIPIIHTDDDGCCKSTIYSLMKIYGDYFTEHFSETGRSNYWILMERRN